MKRVKSVQSSGGWRSRGIPKNETAFIRFNSSECRACWNCIEVCPEKVFVKMNILVHKHVLIRNSEDCIGCGKCVNICRSGALSRINKNETGGAK
ncbi:MAG TPA: 4Fe-4S binding protein [Spirochaetota bacterium]|nr:4Fe-4S binding protein [Spirochaetota bacterium]